MLACTSTYVSKMVPVIREVISGSVSERHSKSMHYFIMETLYYVKPRYQTDTKECAFVNDVDM